ncbi:MAG: hypothetical protein ACYSOJ_04445 [Planctomycetota bacterium]|jgi:hypothetical protein
MTILTIIYALCIVLGVYLAIKSLNSYVKRMNSKIGRNRKAFEEEYAAYSNDDLLLFLKDLENRKLLEMTAALNVAEVRIHDERIRLLLMQLQSSKIYIIRMRAQDIITNWQSEAES